MESLRQRLAALAARGVESEVACLDAPTAAWLKEVSVPVHALGPGSLGVYAYSARWTPWIRKNAARFDAVIVSGLWQYHGWGTLRGLPAGQPYFVFPHGMLDPWFKRAYPRKHLKKWLYWLLAEYRLLANASAVLFTSEEERTQARQSFWLYRCQEQVVNYGTAGPPGDLTAHRTEYAGVFPALQGKRTLLYLGRLHEKKGVDLLCRAWARMVGAGQDAPNVNLVLAGPGDAAYVEGIRRLIAELGIGNSVQLTGMLSGAVKWGALASADAFILPSHQENFGVAVAEALACGTPVLISKRVNIWREIVEDGAGVAEPDDAAGTEKLVAEWLGGDPACWTARRSAARPCFEKRFTIAASAESLLGVIGRELKRG